MMNNGASALPPAMEVLEETDELPLLTEEDQRLAEATQKEDRKRYHRERTEHSRWFYVALLALIGLTATMIYDHLDKRTTAVPYVVTLRVTDEGQVTLVEPPVPLQDYVVAGEAIQFMIARFIRDRQRLGKDPIEQKDREMDVAAQVCGPNVQQVMLPPQRKAALVAVNMKTLPRPTKSPQTYKVSWTESWSDAQAQFLGEHAFEADVTVERRTIDWTKQEAMAIWMRQPMGLCVSSVVISQEPRFQR